MLHVFCQIFMCSWQFNVSRKCHSFSYSCAIVRLRSLSSDPPRLCSALWCWSWDASKYIYPFSAGKFCHWDEDWQAEGGSEDPPMLPVSTSIALVAVSCSRSRGFQFLIFSSGLLVTPLGCQHQRPDFQVQSASSKLLVPMISNCSLCF